MNKIKLNGCSPDPLMSNLKALGIFRIVAEQIDSEATAYWENDIFVLETKITKDELVEFFLEKYIPTPIVSPWNNGSGFYNVDQTVVDKIKKNNDPRFDKYRLVLKQVYEIVGDIIPEYKEFIKKRVEKKDNTSSKDDLKEIKITEKEKTTLLIQCRNRLENAVIPWMDVAYVVSSKKPTYGTILGSGGNDGNFEISLNFMDHLTELIIKPDESEKPNKKSIYARRKELINNSFYNTSVELEESSFAFFHPGRYTGIASSGRKKYSFVNPWNFILTIEGTMLFAGSISKRSNSKRAAFPFTTNSSTAGYPTASDEKTRGEIWIPLWNNPATYDEIKYVFNEGRAQTGSKNSITGVDFARAVTSLGTERGLSEFQRFGLFERKGQAYFANSISRISVVEKSETSLFLDIETWIDRISKKYNVNKSPKSIDSLLHSVDDAIINFCIYGKKRYLQDVLITIGKIERTVSQSSSYSKEIKPIQKLSYDWIPACYDSTPEFRLAVSLAAISSGEKKQLRHNLEPIKINPSPEWAPENSSAVWKNSGIVDNMIKILERRYMEGQMRDSKIHLNSAIFSPVKDVMRFIEGRVDYQKISDLLLPLSMINHKDKRPDYCNQRDLWTLPDFVPESYIALKSNFPPKGFKNSNIVKNSLFEPTIIGLLKAGKIDNAAQMARRRLRITGHNVLTYPKTQYHDKIESRQRIDKITASLLFPLSESDREKIIARICNIENSKEKITSQ